MPGILMGVFPAAQNWLDPIGHRSSFPISFEPATDQNGEVLSSIAKPGRKRNGAGQSGAGQSGYSIVIRRLGSKIQGLLHPIGQKSLGL